MHAYMRRALCAGVLAGGVTTLGLALAGPASADTSITSGADGLVSGNQSGISLSAPVDVRDNQVTVVGRDNDAGGSGGSGGQAASGTDSSTGGGASTSGSGGTAAGNQSAVKVEVPVAVEDNQVTVVGEDNSTGGGSAPTPPAPAPVEQPEQPEQPERETNGESGAVSGNQTVADVDVPVTVCGNQVAVIAEGNTTDCQRTATGVTTPDQQQSPASTTGQDGVLSGNQTGLNVLAPLDLTENQIVVIGQDNTNTPGSGTGTGETDGTDGGNTSNETTGENGLGSGNQTGLTVLAPLDLTGNQIVVIGQDNTNTPGSGTGTGETDGTDGGNTSNETTGENGLGSGNQTGLTVLAPLDLTGNQIVVIGQDNTNTPGSGTGTGETDGTDGGNTSNETTGENGLGSGNQTGLTVLAPLDLTGNQLVVIGQDNTNTPGSGSGDGPAPEGEGTEDGGTVEDPPTGPADNGPADNGPSTSNVVLIGAGGTGTLPASGLSRVQAGVVTTPVGAVADSGDGSLPRVLANTGAPGGPVQMVGLLLLSLLLLGGGLRLARSSRRTAATT